MSRTNRRHTRQIERHRHNKGPEMLCRAADNALQHKAEEMAQSLSKAMIESGDVAAAGLLVALAEAACQEENLAMAGQRISLAQKWTAEPQVAELNTSQRLGGTATRLLLTGGGARSGGTRSQDAEIVDAEFEVVPDTIGSE